MGRGQPGGSQGQGAIATSDIAGSAWRGTEGTLSTRCRETWFRNKTERFAKGQMEVCKAVMKTERLSQPAVLHQTVDIAWKHNETVFFLFSFSVRVQEPPRTPLPLVCHYLVNRPSPASPLPSPH